MNGPNFKIILQQIYEIQNCKAIAGEASTTSGFIIFIKTSSKIIDNDDAKII